MGFATGQRRPRRCGTTLEAPKGGKKPSARKDRRLSFLTPIHPSAYLKVGEFLNRWLENSVKGSESPRTYSNYQLQVRRHLTPTLGRIQLKDLTPFKVQGLYRSKLDAGLSNASVRYTHAVLHRALKQAVKWSLVPRNVAEAVDSPRVRREEITPLSPEQSRTFLAMAREDHLEALYVVALTCGLRQGEILGLKWSDVDLEAKALRVNRQLQRLRRDGDTPGRLVFAEPKNASRRMGRQALLA